MASDIRSLITESYLHTLGLSMLQEEDLNAGLVWVNEAWQEVHGETRDINPYLPEHVESFDETDNGTVEINGDFDFITCVVFKNNVTKETADLKSCTKNHIFLNDPEKTIRSTPAYYTHDKTHVTVWPVPDGDFTLYVRMIDPVPEINFGTTFSDIPLPAHMILKLKEHVKLQIVMCEAGIRSRSDIEHYKNVWKNAVDKIKEEFTSATQLTDDTELFL